MSQLPDPNTATALAREESEHVGLQANQYPVLSQSCSLELTHHTQYGRRLGSPRAKEGVEGIGGGAVVVEVRVGELFYLREIGRGGVGSLGLPARMD